MSCFGATISSFFNGKVKKNMKKKNDIQKVEEKVQYFSYYFFRAFLLQLGKRRTFTWDAPLGSTFIAGLVGGKFFPLLCHQ